MFNNTKIKEMERRINDLCERVIELEAYRDKEYFRERNLKYFVKQSIMADIKFRNMLENNIASDVLMRLQDKESDVNLEKLIKIKLNSMYGVFKSNNSSYLPGEGKIAMLCDIIQLAKKSTTFWNEKDKRITISYVRKGECVSYCGFDKDKLDTDFVTMIGLIVKNLKEELKDV